MISKSDPDYQETKRIVLGTRKMSRKASIIADRIVETFGVLPINIYFDRAAPDKRHRVQVIFKTRSDVHRFMDPQDQNFDKEKQAVVMSFVKETLVLPRLNPSRRKNGFVVFTDFNSVARDDVYHSVDKTQILETVKGVLPNVWHIEHLLMYPAIFLRTKADVEALDAATKRTVISRIHSLLRKQDFCGCFGDPPHVVFDSKENFETAYQGNWFYYSRDH